MVIFAYTMVKTDIQGNVSTFNIILAGIGGGLGEGFFAIPHFLLAVKYNSMAHKIPQMFEGKDYVSEPWFYKHCYKSMLILNVVSGPLRALAVILFQF